MTIYYLMQKNKNYTFVNFYSIHPLNNGNSMKGKTQKILLDILIGFIKFRGFYP